MRPVHSDMSSLVQSRIAVSSKELSSVASGPGDVRKEKGVDEVFDQNSVGDASGEDAQDEFKVNVIERIVEGINEYLQSTNRRLTCRLHEATGRTVVTVVNNVTGDVIREIPTEKTLRLATRMKEANSLLLDGTI